MSTVDQNVDLAGLSRKVPSIQPPRRGWMRAVVPLTLLGAFAFILRDAIGELLTERIPVTLTRPVRLEGPGQTVTQRTLLTQAAGWIEPDPFPVHAPALAAGIVLEVLVQESDEVKEGQPIARLIDDDARIARDRARGKLTVSEAEVDLAAAELRIAEASFEAAIEVTAARDAARARHSGRVAAAAEAAAAVRGGVAEVSLAESEVQVQRALEEAGTSGPRQVEIADADLEVAAGRLSALRAAAALASAAAGEAAAELTRAERHLELRFEEQRLIDTGRARLARAKGAVDEARASLAEAMLALNRMVIRAPQDGIVLERLAVTGDELEAGGPVCSLYDPATLRVRVDVPQADVGALAPGQEAEVLADSRTSRPYAGEVLRIVQLADIQKVTLEVQVRVLDADNLLRPDMLAQVRFFSGAEPAAEGPAAQATRRLAVPAELVRDGAVWVHQPEGNLAVRREIKTGPERRGPDGQRLIEVLEGLDWTVELIDRGRDRFPSDAPTAGVPITLTQQAGRAAGGDQP
ncbi:efflux RND transporter periplasmic adaptor subunit [bacterium]|nr:efflux RND transporter periplasmic adaptor subunit [bacterium]